MENKPEFLNQLNDVQRKAVEYIDGPSLVIAGAGSGKTRVLTYKIAYLLTQGYKAWEIMALTFTNKAANEMKERIGNILNDNQTRYLCMGTFHSVFARILRAEANTIGYSSNFTIYDDADSRSLCKAIIKDMQLDDKVYKPATVAGRISRAKNNLILHTDYDSKVELVERDKMENIPAMPIIYKEYVRRCRQSNAMDFDDLLVNTYLLLKNNAELLHKYNTIYRYVLVDEYQDTNKVQQKIIDLLTQEHKHICAVGDDAQSIYAFRGANIENIINFEANNNGTRLFKLEQNYRSTQLIVEAANSLIQKNHMQIKKDVFSENDKGELVQVAVLSSDREEALYVCKDIKQRVRKELRSFSDFAILYRTNAQSRTFEEQFMKDGVPYRIHGGLSFYQRKEIKDIVAYFRLVINADDDEALKRVINYPARGIGNTTILKLQAAALEAQTSMWQVLCQPERTSLDVNKGTMTKLTNFRMLIDDFTSHLDTDDALTLGTDIIKRSGISQDLHADTSVEAQARRENMEEFISSLNEFVETQREEGNPTSLTDFLHDVSLLSDRDEEDDDTPKVTLMTIHSAKGLEFPCVYVVGMEENLFPSPRSQDSPLELEEERRLLYVAITRAKEQCYLTCAKMRYQFGRMEFSAPSRFLHDINSNLLHYCYGEADRYSRRSTGMQNSHPVASQFRADPKPKITAPKTVQKATMPYSDSFLKEFESHGGNLKKVSSALSSGGRQSPISSPNATGGAYLSQVSIGMRVSHSRFGMGTVTNTSGNGDSAKAIVTFDNAGEKNLLLKFAKLQKA